MRVLMRSSLGNRWAIGRPDRGRKDIPRSESQLRRSRMFIDTCNQAKTSSFKSEMLQASPRVPHYAPDGAPASLTTRIYKHYLPTGFYCGRGSSGHLKLDLCYHKKITRFLLSTIALLLTVAHGYAQPRITIDHNDNHTATTEYKFSRVPSPARSDA